MFLKKIIHKQAHMVRYVGYATGIFVAAAFLGYYTALYRTEEMAYFFEQLVQDLAGLDGVGPVTLFLLVFFNNSIKTFAVVLMGFFFGIVPAFFLFANGYILGIVAFFAQQQVGVQLLLLGTVPHGIVEIPVMIVASSYGLWLGSRFLRSLRTKQSLKHDIKTVILLYVNVFVPLFLFAAFIEVFVTSAILLSVMSAPAILG